MDLIKLQNVNAPDVANEQSVAETSCVSRDKNFAPLSDWEMLLVGGGEGIPCW